MRAHLLAAATATACGLMVLAGCGEKAPEPAPVESSTPTASPSPSVSAAPTMPPEAKKKGAQGAEAFVRHYVALINHAQATGDVQRLEATSGPNCESCSKGITVVKNIYTNGGRIEGGAWKIVSVTAVLPRSDIKGWLVEIDVVFGPQTVQEGGKSKRLDGGRSPFSFTISGKGTEWRVAEWTRGR